ncbi:MAG: lipid-A-disaccharide synthase N-terminal domain-containing protein [FCB group bacterium]|nr:lipid-A-disaccharide synthase N-terminal domain-containing protein [FCB group bacterium]
MGGLFEWRMPSPWELVGWIGAVIFFGRFYVQWIASELHKRSVVPELFWYMSIVGSPMLFLYAFAEHEPLGAFSQCLNIIIYARNLNHIWKAQKRFSRRTRYLFQGAAVLLTAVALAMLFITWRNHYFEVTQDDKVARTVFWATVWLVGQLLFGTRFLIQWAVTEYRRKSVMPTAFWYVSIVAAVLQASAFAFASSQEYLFAIGTAATLPVYIRNLVLIHRGGEVAAPKSA